MINEKVKFIWETSIFLAILIFCIFIINLFYIKKIEVEKLNFKKEEDFQKYVKNLENREINYLFLGDSHTRDAVNPRYIDNSYNLGCASENYIKTYFKLKKAIKQDEIKIKNVILEIDLHTLYYTANAEDVKFNFSYKNENNMALPSIIFNKLFLFIGHGNELFYLYNHDIKTEIYLGYTLRKINFANNNMQRIAKQKCYKHFNGKYIQKNNMFYLLKTIQLAINNNIEINFIEYPISKAYDQETKNLRINRVEYYKNIFNEIDKAFPCLKYKQFDYYDIFFNYDEYFSNSDHLNYKGAEVLSKQINIDLNK